VGWGLFELVVRGLADSPTRRLAVAGARLGL
jgi:hypothetical protein